MDLRYKTELCKSWELIGRCPYGRMCRFAHGKSELEEKHVFSEYYKTRACKNFTKKGFCMYGEKCQFIHKQTKSNKEDIFKKLNWIFLTLIS